jgi:CheY-like chemotaxis protein
MTKLIHIIDDDRDLAESLVDVLDALGYRAEWSIGGVEGLERLRHGPQPHILLLDLMMPRMSGWEVCEALTGSAELDAIPIILMTAASNLKLPLPRRAQFLLSKPFDLQELLGQIEG